jgi:hypothetical protein
MLPAFKHRIVAKAESTELQHDLAGFRACLENKSVPTVARPFPRRKRIDSDKWKDRYYSEANGQNVPR